MTVEKLAKLLQAEVDKGNGHMTVGLTIENFGMSVSAGLFSPVKVGVTEKWDTVWIVGQGGMRIEKQP